MKATQNNNPSVVKDNEYSTSRSLLLVAMQWQRGAKKALESIGITPAQCDVLSALLLASKQKTSPTQTDLAQVTQTDPMTLSAIIRILERKELIARRENEKDTRSKVVVITSSGLKVARQGQRIIEKFDRQFFEVLGTRSKSFLSALKVLLKGRK